MAEGLLKPVVMRKILSKDILTGTRGRRAILFIAMGLGAVFCRSARAEQSVTLAWNPSPSASVAGYMVSYGSDGINFSNQVDAGTNTNWTVAGLQDGSTNYFEVSAYDVNYNESPPCAPVEYVVPVPAQTVAVAANPAGAGSVSGGGSYVTGSSVTVTAAANSGYSFANWTENGTVQSASPGYSFTLAANRNLTANFTNNPVSNTNSSTTNSNTTSSHTNNSSTINSNANSLLTVLVSGNGAVTPNLNGRMLTGARRYTLLATAGTGWVFSDWTSNGVVVAGGPAHTFLMAPGLVLQANFVTNPFTAVAGSYEGLFYDTNNVAQEI